MSLAIVFPGQGAQAPGLGVDWIDHPSWEVLERDFEGVETDLEHLLIKADRSELADTHNSQLAVLAASLIAWDALKPTLRSPAFMAGHSLGQVTALIASETLSTPQAQQFAQGRALASREAQRSANGGLIVLIGADESIAKAACDRHPNQSWVANLNAPGQVVIGAAKDVLDLVSADAVELGARRAMRLGVDGAFHTPLMASAVTALIPSIAELDVSEGICPVFANDSAEVPNGAEQWRASLTAHMVKPVLWADTIRAMSKRGVSEIVEVGPGKTLTGLIKRIEPSIATHNVSSPAEVERLAEIWNQRNSLSGPDLAPVSAK